jgi:hypothetical protein
MVYANILRFEYRLLQNVNVTPAVLAAGNLQVLVVLKLNMAKSHEYNL